MGGIKTVFYILLIIVAAAFVVYYVNVALFCKDSSGIDLKLFRINCGLIPDKPTQLDDAFSSVCNDFKTNYNCDMKKINSVTTEYTEFGKQTQNYSLTQLCHLKNQYYIGNQCARLCGCTNVL